MSCSCLSIGAVGHLGSRLLLKKCFFFFWAVHVLMGKLCGRVGLLGTSFTVASSSVFI
jgi:hypothetical protein